MSDHPEFAKFKKIQLLTIKNAQKEGYLVKKGADFHTWKKRWFVMKDHYIYYFTKNSPNAVPKGIIEINEKSTVQLLEDSRKPTILINSVHRTQEINSETLEDAKNWTEAIKQQIENFKINPQTDEIYSFVDKTNIPEQKQTYCPPLDKVEIPVMQWQEVQTRLTEEKNCDSNKFRELLVSIGKSTCERYFYSICEIIMGTWKDTEIGDFWWDNFCEGDLKDIEMFAGGIQGDSSICGMEPTDNRSTDKNVIQVHSKTITSGQSEKPSQPNIQTSQSTERLQTQSVIQIGQKPQNEQTEKQKRITQKPSESLGTVIFVLGRTENGAQRLANIYNYLINKYCYSCFEVRKCIMQAISDWGIKTNEVFFTVLVVDLIKNWKAEDVIAMIKEIIMYTDRYETYQWEQYPDHVNNFFSLFVLFTLFNYI
ncbi:hypothetical protein EIN_274500 [Entamoeba invadens IP1]|uniref:PH domain-containing protein n=1 Tax=Entamoeba invadens IP1 TaxID=370355 RepID=A0A0A1U4Q5_ENTIV|nr:hypothetical protein EIN_274500 [Entamoeba invadens IP1]ELP87873.1 hypothetical protein EIN_274500 [Entamoeba invadens IP1]|eukprot:XP_004254644.1 hypothetical protein EIN_274500 [Entamoeba invadens IP1]